MEEPLGTAGFPSGRRTFDNDLLNGIQSNQGNAVRCIAALRENDGQRDHLAPSLPYLPLEDEGYPDVRGHRERKIRGEVGAR